jgi:glycerol-3-phosphate dehydrogenase
MKFDFLIVGGGITGASIALLLSKNGYKILLADCNDFAFGTSSRSTKLIHGGLRYLKEGDFKLVYKTGRERKILKNHAPNLIYSEHMLIPITKQSEFNKLSLKLGLSIYDWFTRVAKEEKHKMLNASEAILIEPLLDETQLKGAAIYTEYRCDDARLVYSILKTAQNSGAQLYSYHKVSSISRLADSTTFKIKLKNTLTDEDIEIQSNAIINASGPWSDEFRKSTLSTFKPKLQLSKGVHIVLPYSKFPIKQNMYFNHTDGRMIFAIIRTGKVYVGTTDTPYTGLVENVHTEMKDVEYLIDAVNLFSPTLNLKVDDIESHWCGIRPLILDKTKKNTSSISRKDEVFEDEYGIITIAGGKLTGCLSMAMDVADFLKKKGYLVNKVKPLPRELKFSGCEFESESDISDYFEQQVGESKQIGGTPKSISRLIHTYGKHTEQIVDLAYRIWPEFNDKSIVLLCAEILFSIENEWVKTYSDFWIRRTGNLYFRKTEVLDEFEKTKEWFATKLNWNKETALKMEYEFLHEYDFSAISNLL